MPSVRQLTKDPFIVCPHGLTCEAFKLRQKKTDCQFTMKFDWIASPPVRLNAKKIDAMAFNQTLFFTKGHFYFYSAHRTDYVVNDDSVHSGYIAPLRLASIASIACIICESAALSFFITRSWVCVNNVLKFNMIFFRILHIYLMRQLLWELAASQRYTIVISFNARASYFFFLFILS